MDDLSVNLKAFYFSPQFWWKTFERAINLTDAFGEEIDSIFSFKKWIQTGTVEHDSISINLEHDYKTDKEYTEAIKNDYFFEIIGVNHLGHQVSAKSYEDLLEKHQIKEEIPLKYSFRIYDLNQFISMYVQQWLVFDSYYYWVKWQLYFDFIISKLNTPSKELFLYMWTLIFNEVEFEHNLFKDVNQYKMFRDKLDDIKKESSYVENEIIKIRKKKKK